MKLWFAFTIISLFWSSAAAAVDSAEGGVDESEEQSILQREMNRLSPQIMSRPSSAPEQTKMKELPEPLPFVESEDLDFPEDDECAAVHDVQSEEHDAKEKIFVPSSTNKPATPQPRQLEEDKSLSDTLKSQKKESLPIPLPNVEGTWVDKLKTKVSSSLTQKDAGEDGDADDGDGFAENSADENLDKLVKKSKESKKRSNASVFDISGIMLRMNVSQVENAMRGRGFKLLSQKYEIPNFIKWRNEEKCRNNGVVGFERLGNCVVDMSKKDNHQYTESMRFSNFKTKEEISVNFTSNFTNNKVYRVMYKSISPRIVGSGQKSQYLRNIKIYDFWRKVNQKYGAPDNKDEVTWGLGSNSPYLKAATGFLVLEDPMLRELDYTRMSREDQRFLHTDLYNF